MKAKRISIICLLMMLVLASCTTPKVASAEFLQGTWTSVEYKTNYGFIGKNTMLISDDIEGEEYHYSIKADTIIFAMKIDEMIGNVLESDTMTYSIIDENTIELNYQGLFTHIVRNP